REGAGYERTGSSHLFLRRACDTGRPYDLARQSSVLCILGDRGRPDFPRMGEDQRVSSAMASGGRGLRGSVSRGDDFVAGRTAGTRGDLLAVRIGLGDG